MMTLLHCMQLIKTQGFCLVCLFFTFVGTNALHCFTGQESVTGYPRDVEEPNATEKKKSTKWLKWLLMIFSYTYRLVLCPVVISKDFSSSRSEHVHSDVIYRENLNWRSPLNPIQLHVREPLWRREERL